MMPRRVLIIGGTGVFGKRLTRHLTQFSGLEVFVASRSKDKAQAFVQSLAQGTSASRFHGVALDHGKNLDQVLTSVAPFAVIDCSGPFQAADYATPKRILRAGAHLIDLADARGYLAGFSAALNDIAKDHNVTALTGASSTPTLSASVVKVLTKDWSSVDSIDIAITPGGKSDVGRAVIEAILSYAGKSIPVWHDGQVAQTTGWRGGHVINVPDLGQRRVAAVETYDAEYLGARHHVTSHVRFAAGLESRVEQYGIETHAALRSFGLRPDIKFLIPTLLKARILTRILTSDKGGMTVRCSGLDAAGQRDAAQWTLIAKNDHGPYVPILPAAAALQKLLVTDLSAGAAIADEVLDLTDITAQMRPYDITFRETGSQSGYAGNCSSAFFKASPQPEAMD